MRSRLSWLLMNSRLCNKGSVGLNSRSLSWESAATSLSRSERSTIPSEERRCRPNITERSRRCLAKAMKPLDTKKSGKPTPIQAAKLNLFLLKLIPKVWWMLFKPAVPNFRFRASGSPNGSQLSGIDLTSSCGLHSGGPDVKRICLSTG